MRRALILTAVLALLPALASADEVLLKGGGRISGRILSRTDTAVQVDVGAGIITVPMASVLSIEEKRSALDDYEERAAKLRANDVPGWLGTLASGAVLAMYVCFLLALAWGVGRVARAGGRPPSDAPTPRPAARGAVPASA